MAVFTVSDLTLTDNENRYGYGVTLWALNGTSADASACEELKAAGGTNTNHYLTKLTISCSAAINVTVGTGESSSAVETVIMGPIYFLADGNTFASWVFDNPIKLAANKALTADASGAGAITIYAEGFTR